MGWIVGSLTSDPPFGGRLGHSPVAHLVFGLRVLCGRRHARCPSPFCPPSPGRAACRSSSGFSGAGAPPLPPVREGEAWRTGINRSGPGASEAPLLLESPFHFHFCARRSSEVHRRDRYHVRLRRNEDPVIQPEGSTREPLCDPPTAKKIQDLPLRDRFRSLGLSWMVEDRLVRGIGKKQKVARRLEDRD